MTVNKKGKWIAVDGLDGAGKGTAIETIKQLFENAGLSVSVVKIIGSGLAGSVLRGPITSRNLSKQTAKMALATCFTDAYNKIQSDLLTHDIVIADRYIASFYAYNYRSPNFYNEYALQALGSTLLNSVLLNKDFMPHSPDMEFFINTDPKLCKERIDSRQDEEGKKYTDFEPLEWFVQLQKYFLDYYKHYRNDCCIIANNDSLESFQSKIHYSISTLPIK